MPAPKTVMPDAKALLSVPWLLPLCCRSEQHPPHPAIAAAAPAPPSAAAISTFPILRGLKDSWGQGERVLLSVDKTEVPAFKAIIPRVGRVGPAAQDGEGHR